MGNKILEVSAQQINEAVRKVQEKNITIDDVVKEIAKHNANEATHDDLRLIVKKLQEKVADLEDTLFELKSGSSFGD
jgi:uncharacterized FlaG/YvyC family protein